MSDVLDINAGQYRAYCVDNIFPVTEGHCISLFEEADGFTLRIAKRLKKDSYPNLFYTDLFLAKSFKQANRIGVSLLNKIRMDKLIKLESQRKPGTPMLGLNPIILSYFPKHP